jgi:phage terminase large subunit-like protein
MALQLQGAGYRMVEVRQGYFTLSEPSKLFEALVRSRRLRHDGHKVLRWCVSNVAVKEDPNENIRPIKPSKKKRIDGVTATIIGLSRLVHAVQKTPARISFFSDQPPTPEVANEEDAA